MSTTAGIHQLTSVQGLARLFAERGAQLVVVLLIIGLGLDSALILTRALNPLGAVPASTAALAPAGMRTVNPQVALGTIINAHLFGSAAGSTSLDAPPTTMPLILAGVLAVRDPARGQAIIGTNAAAAKLYSVGAAIPGGARLHAVYGDRVLLERNGGLETLMLPRTPLPGAAALLPAATRERTVQGNPALLAGLVRVQPVFSQGKLSGYRIFPGPARGAPAAFGQLGLRAGDLIVAVNGTGLDDPARAMEVLQTLSSSGSATVTVSRNGTQQEINLNLASVSAAEQPDADGATSAPAPDAVSPVGRRRFRGLPPQRAFGGANSDAPAGDNAYGANPP